MTKTAVKDFVFEIGVEELPASYIRPALEQLRQAAELYFSEQHLAHAGVRVDGTPRRLALMVAGLQERQPDQDEEVQGPSAKVAFTPEGKPTQIGEGFARGKGVEPSKLVVKSTPKGDYIFARVHTPGKFTTQLLAEWLPQITKRLAFPKSMRWSDGGPLRFARPISWLLALYGDKVVKFDLEHLKSGDTTYGHRFLAPQAITLKHASDYEKKLAAAEVTLSFEKRCAGLRAEMDKAAKKFGHVLQDDELVETVANLIEEPAALAGNFDAKYLALPPVVIIKVLREHQTCFAVESAPGKLAPVFVAAMNGPRKELEPIREGNARVIRARLEDAVFFYNEDQKVTLEQRVDGLKSVVWLEKLGTLHDKVTRLERLAAWIAERIAPEQAAHAARAARLCKSDLLSLVVGEKEFTSLQGEMGGIYARLGGESEEAAQAIAEHYRPRYSGDQIPKSLAGKAVALADKMDELAGLFGIGMLPTGSQDPYALRRKAAGMIAILSQVEAELSLKELCEQAVALFGERLTTERGLLLTQLLDFLRGRLETALIEQGYGAELVQAVAASRGEYVRESFARAAALDSVRERPDFDLATQAFSRVTNILSKVGTVQAVDASLLQEGAERMLHDRYLAARPSVERACQAGRYEQAFAQLAELRPAIDAYFNDVMVMADDPRVRTNRLSFLSQMAQTVQLIADFRKLAKK